MRNGMTGRPVRTIVLLVVIALLALVPLLAWEVVREPSKDGAPREADATGASDPSAGLPALRARARAPWEPEAPDGQLVPLPMGDPLYVDGWPAADVIVRRHDGTPVAGAFVYVHPAGADSPSNIGFVPARRTGADGTVRLPVAAAGRYDVGAFGTSPFGALALDVEIPARTPVGIVLPDLVRLDVRRIGDLSEKGWVSISRADARRIRSHPGRNEGRYVGGAVHAIGDHVLVPRDVRLRVRAWEGVVAQPEEVVAPGPVTLSADLRRKVPVEFVFVPAPDLATQWLQFEFRTEDEPGDPESWTAQTVHLRPSPDLTSVREEVLCPPALTTVRWRVASDPGRNGGEAVIDGAASGAAQRIEVPVSREKLFLFGFKVIPPTGQEVRRIHVLTAAGRLFEHVLGTGREYWFASPRESSDGLRAVSEQIVAVAADDHDRPLVAGPTNVAPDRVVELHLVPCANLRVGWTRPAAVDASWPLHVSLAEPKPLADLLVHEPALALVREAVICEPSAVLGPFPEGDVELVFRFGGREIGRRKVKVVPGPPIDVEAPEILPPPR